jgi:hypothetical protein
VQVQNRSLGGTPLNFINGCSLGVANRDFLLMLGGNLIERDLYLGRVYGPNGVLQRGWVTFRGRRSVIVRGTQHVSYRRCELCGQQVYFAMGPPYLCPAPPPDASLYEAGIGALLVPKELYERIDVGSWPELAVDELGVVDRPQDGLPEVIV